MGHSLLIPGVNEYLYLLNFFLKKDWCLLGPSHPENYMCSLKKFGKFKTAE